MTKKNIRQIALIGILAAIFLKRNTVMYGVLTADSLDDMIIDVTKTLGGGLNAALLLAETAAAETNYGDGLPAAWSDVGVMQFTTIGFMHVRENTSQARKNTIKTKYGIDIDSLTLLSLQYSPLTSVIFARLYYLLIPSAIPSTLSERAAYWKKYYNSALGAGTVEHYIKLAQANPRPRVSGAF
jgi:hypothetical protein